MEYTFDILFRIDIIHPAVDPVSRAFSLVPTSGCQAQLRKAGLIAKPVENGTWIIVEKVLPGNQPLRPITTLVNFQFLLLLHQPAILDTTDGFQSDGGNTFPSYVGRKFLLQLSNLDDAGTIDGRINLAKSGTTVGTEDLASISGQLHSFSVDPAVNSVDFQSLRPFDDREFIRTVSEGNIVHIGDPPTLEKPFFTPVPAGSWRVKQSPSGVIDEVLITDDSLVQQRAFGLVEIFKDASVDYDSPIIYQIPFDTAS